MTDVDAPPFIKNEFVDNLRTFAINALDLLKAQYETPRFYRPRYPLHYSWRRDSKDPERLHRVPRSAVWKVVSDSFQWPDWNSIRKISSYDSMRIFIDKDQGLQRRLRIAYIAPYEDIELGDLSQMSALDFLLQDALLLPMINSNQNFDFTDSGFASACKGVFDSLSNKTVSWRKITPLRHVQSVESVALSPGCVLRYLSEKEISAGDGFGSLPIRHTATGSTYLPLIYQFAIVQSVDIEIDVDADQEVFERQLQQALKNRRDELSDTIVSAINILSKGVCARGEGWTSITTSSASQRMRDGVEYQSIRKEAWRTPTCDLDEIPTQQLSDLVSNLSEPRIRKKLEVAVERLNNAVNRISDEEAVVDLAIAAESLFGTRDPGETTFKTSLNAALFLGGTEYSASYVRKFFRTVYTTRSKIVHGHSKLPKEVAGGGLPSLRNELTGHIKSALKRAAHDLRSNADALEWEQRLDDLLDSSS
ncbi:HEPN domain-containing protein [Nocardia jejuensis]|uniref:HEPN domain-containing protein n=1 Tax=Nocardia jejuensis TaxID=328049 RepID=UPI000A90F7F9|nr:HEPN domain-containing protein [Nocardia jejuensis]